MKANRDRYHFGATNDDQSDDFEIGSPKNDQLSCCSCDRRLGSPYAELDDRYDIETDVLDILEDYLSLDGSAAPQPLVLDMWEGVWTSIPGFRRAGIEITVGTSVILKNGTFLRVKEILQEERFDEIVLRGHKLVHAHSLQPILDVDENNMELLLDYRNFRKSKATVLDQSLVDVPFCRVDQTVVIHITNYEKPSHTPRGVYFCRWKLTRHYQDSPGKKCRAVEVAIERVRSGEADSGFHISDDVLRYNWRGHVSEQPGLGDSYSALDGFCCGGGWSRGAEMAGGVKVARSFDIEEKACRTYRDNFPHVKCMEADVHDYCLPQNLSPELREMAITPEYVDIAHYSTPCQFFSPAHTRPGPNDDKNVAASFCLGHLLDKDRPRVVTFENTSGLERRHFGMLKAIFGQVTSKGYSLRFATLRLANYGLPQDRCRLIMLAACPGETLPTFPPPTHSEDALIPGTLDWVSPADVIKRVPFSGWQNHHPSKMKKMALPTKAKRLLPTLTCSNTPQEVHPDGRRYTICEYQLLQGFPLHHRFAMGLTPTQIRAQIGNAFPPSFVKQLVRRIRKQLQKNDGLEETFDADEFMTSEELQEQEINQFFEDNHRLPEGGRANVIFSEEGDYYDEEENDLVERSAFLEDSNTTVADDSSKRPTDFDAKLMENCKRARKTSDPTSTRSTLCSLYSEESSFFRHTTTSSTSTVFSSNSFSSATSNETTSGWSRALSIRPHTPDPRYLIGLSSPRPSLTPSSRVSKTSSKSATNSCPEDSETDLVKAGGTKDSPIEIVELDD